MKVRTLGRHFREGFKNLGRNGWMTVASILSVTITLLILGVFLILAMNVNSFADELENQVEIRAFVERSASEEELTKIESDLQNLQGVESIVYVPKDLGIDQFIESMGEQGHYFTEFRDDNNPLPDVYVVQALNPQETEQLAKEIEGLDHIYKVEYGGSMIDRIFAVTNTVRNIGLIFIVGLAFTAMLLIANTIKITIVARSSEIEIMKLVGATNAFIRWPFFIEGLLLGMIGALIPIVLLLIGYQQLLNWVGDDISSYFFELLPLFPLANQMIVLLLGIGAFIGIWGSITSVRKFLRV